MDQGGRQPPPEDRPSPAAANEPAPAAREIASHTVVTPQRLLAVAVACQVCLSLSQQGVGVMAIFLRDRLHLGLAAMGGMVSATACGMMLANVAGGAAVDRLGSRPVAAGGTVGVALVLLWLGLRLPASYLALLLLLCLLGLLTAPVGMAGARAVFLAYAAGRRGFAMGVRQTGVTVGSALAAALLPLSVGVLGLGSTFAWLAAAVVVPGLLLAWCAGERGGGRPARRPVRPTAAGPGGTRTGRAALRAIARPAAVGLLMSAGQYDVLTYTISDLHARAALSIVAAGLALAWVQVGGTVARVLFGWWSDHTGRRRSTFVAAIAAAGCCLFALLAVLPAVSGAALDAFFLVLGATAVGWNAVLITWAGEAAGPREAGLGMGAVASSVFLGATLFPPLFGALVTAGGSYAYGWALVAVMYTAAAVLAGRDAGGRPACPTVSRAG